MHGGIIAATTKTGIESFNLFLKLIITIFRVL